MEEKNLRLVTFLFIVTCAFISVADTHAEIFKHVGQDGRITYSSQAIKGKKALPFDPSLSKTNQNKSTKYYPNVGQRTQSERDIKRRKILENELATEYRLYVIAKQNLMKAEKNVQVSVTNKNHAQPNLYEYKNEVKKQKLLHQRNILALKKEMAN